MRCVGFVEGLGCRVRSLGFRRLGLFKDLACRSFVKGSFQGPFEGFLRGFRDLMVVV